MAKTDEYGWTEAPPHSSTYLHDPVLAILARERPAKVIDIGCGNGFLADDIAARGFSVLGVDGDSDGLVLARARGSSARFAECDFERPFGEQDLGGAETFDLAVSTEVVEHLYDPRVLPRFAWEALRPGGLFVITTPYHGYLKNLALSLANKWDSHISPHWYGGHIKFWSRVTLTQLLTDAGFTVESFAGIGRMPYMWKSMILTARKPAGPKT